MLSQLTPVSEDAPVALRAIAVICFSSLCQLIKPDRDGRPEGSLRTFVRVDVGSHLSYRKPYPSDYSPTFAFSFLLYPHTHGQTLRFTVPNGEMFGLTMFRRFDTVG